MKIKRKKGSGKEHYFNATVEDAVKKYNDPATSAADKERIFSNVLYAPLTKLVNGVVDSYPKFVGVCGVDELKARAFVNLYENMYQFDPESIGKDGKPAKAFSYYGTIVRNYVKTHSRKTYADEGKYDNWDSHTTHFENTLDNSYDIDGNPIERIYDNMVNHITAQLRKEISENLALKVNDVKIANALIGICENWSSIYDIEAQGLTPFFLKKKLHQNIGEITGLSSKEVKNSIKLFQKVYANMVKLLIKAE